MMNFDFDFFEVRLSISPDDNQFTIGEEIYILEELYPGAKTGKGGNSCVFSARPVGETFPTKVVKFCRFPIDPSDENYSDRIARFHFEIKALNAARRSDWNDQIIRIDAAGQKIIPGSGRNVDQIDVTLVYYVMEIAESDLERHLQENDLNWSQKVDVMKQLVQCIKALHALGYRHRDLKPDNIFYIKGRLKVGDLGLIDSDIDNHDLDGTREKIGPSGYLSP